MGCQISCPKDLTSFSSLSLAQFLQKERMALEFKHLLHQGITSNDPQIPATIQKALQRRASFYNNPNMRYHESHAVKQSPSIRFSSFLK